MDDQSIPTFDDIPVPTEPEPSNLEPMNAGPITTYSIPPDERTLLSLPSGEVQVVDPAPQQLPSSTLELAQPAMPDKVPEQLIGGGSILALLATALTSDDPWVRRGAIVGVVLVAVGLVWMRAVTAKARNTRLAMVQSQAVQAVGQKPGRLDLLA